MQIFLLHAISLHWPSRKSLQKALDLQQTGSYIASVHSKNNDCRSSTLGLLIRKTRTERGMGVRELAEASGLSHPFILDIEKGARNASDDSLRRIAAALEIDPQLLIDAAKGGAK